MDVILHIAIAQFLFAALIVLTKKPRHISDTLLGVWLLLMTIFMTLTLLKNEFADSFWGQLQMFPFFFTFGPFLYMYVRMLVEEAGELEFKDSLHILPFVIFSTAAVVMDSPVDEDILAGKAFLPRNLALTASALISVVVYSTLVTRLLRKHQQKILDHFSYTSGRIDLSWLRLLVIGFMVMMVIVTFTALLNNMTPEPILNPGVFLFLGMAIFAFAVSFYGIRQPSIFRPRQEKVDDRFESDLEEPGRKESAEEEVETDDPTDSEDEKSGKYARSSLREDQAESYRVLLIDYLEKEKPFLRRDLNIQDVAQDLGIPQHHLTQTINEYMQKNFYTLVNEYRVEEVKHRMINKKYAHLTLLAIAHDAGFNSKSAFNMIFKNHTGMTPSEYRKKNL
ncbi:MAG: AraC family transcriptional regulator [Bacteroidia bacterium]|nr:AraC family transcriptional regulator [Bacteroidia bacterium]